MGVFARGVFARWGPDVLLDLGRVRSVTVNRAVVELEFKNCVLPTQVNRSIRGRFHLT